MRERKREHVEFSIPADWDAQLEKWMAERGPEWCAALDEDIRSSQPLGSVMDWTAERVYELVYLWNDRHEVGARICRWWVQLGYLPYKDNHKKGLWGIAHLGVISGRVTRMQDKGILERRKNYPEERVRNAIMGKKKLDTHQSSNKVVPNLANILEMRRQRVEQSGGAFDSLTREERGMPAAEIAQQQHPDYPAGVSHDAAYRIEHGRTNLFTAQDSKRLATSRRFLDVCETLDKGIPSASDYDDLRTTQKDLIQHRIKKTMPAVRELLKLFESLSDRGFQPPSIPSNHSLASE